MTKLTKRNIDPKFEAKLKALTGFSVQNPGVRTPVQNPDIDRVIALRSAPEQSRMAQLLQGRWGVFDKDRARTLAWLTGLTPVLAYPDLANAFEGHDGEWAVHGEANDPSWIADFATVMTNAFAADPLGLAVATASLVATYMLSTSVDRVAMATALAAHKVVPDAAQSPNPDNELGEPVAQASKPDWIWATDGASIKGHVRSENQDNFCILDFDPATKVLIVCDGAGGHDGGREAAVQSVDAIGCELQDRWREHGDLTPADLPGAIECAFERARELALEGKTTALVVLLQDDQMHWATLGDGAVCTVWPDGMIGAHQIPHHVRGQPSNRIFACIGNHVSNTPRTGSIRVEPDTFVIVMTDGASDLFPIEDFADQRNHYSRIKDLSLSFLKQLEDSRDPDTNAYLHSDNMTLVLARLTQEGATS